MKQRPVRKLLAIVLSLLLVFAFTPVAFAAEGDVAQIIGKEGAYASLSEAIDAASPGETIQLIDNIEVTGTNFLLDKNLTFDLDGKSITLTNGAIAVYNNAEVTFNNGSIRSNMNVFEVQGDISGGHSNPSSATLNIGSDLTVESEQCCVYIYGNEAVVNVSGKLLSTGNYATVSGNGTHTAEVNRGGTEINILDGADISNSVVDGCAIYLPQDGVCNIRGGSITAGNCIGIKSGTLNVYGGNLTANGTFSADPDEFNNGINATGTAIQIESNTAYVGNVVVNIEGGTISSQNGPAIHEYGSDVDNGLSAITISDNAVLESADSAATDLLINNDGINAGGTGTSRVTVESGTFSKVISENYLPANSISIKAGENYYVGDVAKDELINAGEGDAIEILNGTEFTVGEGAQVTNKTGEAIKVNGVDVTGEDPYTVPTTQEPEPSNPSSSFTEPEYYPDYDEDVDYMPPVEDEEEEEKAPLYMVTCRTLNVRMGPGTSYAKLGTLSRGTLISGEYENGWVKFTYNGQTAYSSADYLMQVDGDLSGLHVTCRTLNVRAGAGTNFDILGTLSRGTEISVRDVLPGWYEIDFLGGIGYVSSAYIG